MSLKENNNNKALLKFVTENYPKARPITIPT